MTLRDSASFAGDVLVILLLGIVYVAGLLAKTVFAYGAWGAHELRDSLGGEPVEHVSKR